jgi:co-chaperonin GroES (HSP10)
MKKNKILGNRIELEVEEPKVAGLNTESMKRAIEVGKVIGIGNTWDLEHDPIKIGDTVLFKSWSVDHADDHGKQRHFLNQTTKGLLCVL